MVETVGSGKAGKADHNRAVGIAAELRHRNSDDGGRSLLGVGLAADLRSGHHLDLGHAAIGIGKLHTTVVQVAAFLFIDPYFDAPYTVDGTALNGSEVGIDGVFGRLIVVDKAIGTERAAAIRIGVVALGIIDTTDSKTDGRISSTAGNLHRGGRAQLAAQVDGQDIGAEELHGQTL